MKKYSVLWRNGRDDKLREMFVHALNPGHAIGNALDHLVEVIGHEDHMIDFPYEAKEVAR